MSQGSAVAASREREQMASDIVIVAGDVSLRPSADGIVSFPAARTEERGDVLPESIGGIGLWLQARASAIARRSLAAGFDQLLPSAGASPGGLRVHEALSAAWKRAMSQDSIEALDLAAQVREAVLDLRIAELRRDPMATAVYDAATEQLDRLGLPLPPYELYAILEGSVDRQLERAVRRLERTSRRHRLLLRDRAVGRARASVLRRLGLLRPHLEEVLGQHLAAFAAVALGDRVARWRENVRASRSLAGGVPPGAGFGPWLADRGWLAPDLGPAAMDEALEAFAGGRLSEGFGWGLSEIELQHEATTSTETHEGVGR